ncbi:MAG TPA: DUF1707 domain-containing protein [Streptosporangiaceae bacterium]|nr:DUF1707 domain-containing protein [Streptosporangiaceae bacterium]
MAAESGVRIGDAEREKVATSLREHYARGRLTLDEFQQRLDAAFAAKTDTDLAKITADLPHADPYAAPWPSSQPYSTVAPSYPIGAGQGSGYQRRGRGPLSYVWACLALCALGALFIVSFSWPFGAPRYLIILLAILAVFRRIFRRIGGRRR